MSSRRKPRADPYSHRSHTLSEAALELGKLLLEKSRAGETDEVLDLMTNGAPFAADWLGTSPLHMAALGGHIETCEALLQAGCLRDARTKVDKTPLHLAAYEGHHKVVEFLVRRGAELEAKDMLLMTPLHWAVEGGHAKTVHVLLQFGASPDVVSKFDQSPLDIALSNGHDDIADILREYVLPPVPRVDPFSAVSFCTTSSPSSTPYFSESSLAGCVTNRHNSQNFERVDMSTSVISDASNSVSSLETCEGEDSSLPEKKGRSHAGFLSCTRKTAATKRSTLKVAALGTSSERPIASTCSSVSTNVSKVMTSDKPAGLCKPIRKVPKPTKLVTINRKRIFAIHGHAINKICSASTLLCSTTPSPLSVRRFSRICSNSKPEITCSAALSSVVNLAQPNNLGKLTLDNDKDGIRKDCLDDDSSDVVSMPSLHSPLSCVSRDHNHRSETEEDETASITGDPFRFLAQAQGLSAEAIADYKLRDEGSIVTSALDCGQSFELSHAGRLALALLPLQGNCGSCSDDARTGSSRNSNNNNRPSAAISTNTLLSTLGSDDDPQSLKRQLEEMRRETEKYKRALEEKEKEAEAYKKRLRLSEKISFLRSFEAI